MPGGSAIHRPSTLEDETEQSRPEFKAKSGLQEEVGGEGVVGNQLLR